MRSVTSLNPFKGMKFGFRALVFTCLVSGFGFSSAAWALPQVQKTGTGCAGTYNANLSCTSNDIQINDVAQMTEGEGGQPPVLSCIEGETVTIDIRLTTLLNANSRYDSLVWIGENGQNPRGTTGLCYVTSLPDDPDSPFILDLEGAPDQCNDTNSSGTAPVDQYLKQVTVDCIDQYTPDPNGNDPDDVIQNPDGELDIFVLVTWFQNNTLACGIGEGLSMTPGVNPKCDAALLLGIDIEVLPASTIQVVKNSSGGFGDFSFTSDVPGLGDFNLDTAGDGTEATAVIDLSGADVGATYSIVETVPDGWSLASATCSNGDTPDAVTPVDGQDVVCTFNDAALGSVTINKISIGGDGSFDFTSDLPDGNFNIATSAGSGMHGETNIPAGVYNIAETVPAGWQLDSATCSDDSVPSALDVSDGETVSCTFTNTKLGTIIVEKQTLPDASGQTFDFTGDAAGTIGDGGTITVSNLVPGAYSSTENVPVGWALTSIVCSDGNSTGNTESGVASFNVEAGETVTCVFTNTQDGSIEVVKSLSATGPLVELFGFTSNFNGAFDLQGDAATTGPIGVVPGSGYTASENDPSANGWANVSATCTGGDDPTSDIVVSPGEAVVCTFTNTPLGSATIVKNTVGGDDTFDFTGDAPFNGLQLTTLAGTASEDFTFQLDAGQYQVTEQPIPAGWALTDLGCIEDGTQDSTVLNPTATMNVELAETVTCTFTNTADGTLIIRKETNPDAAADAFTFTGDAAGVLHDYSSSAEELSVSGQPDVYSSAEIVPDGWSLTNISCTGQSASTIDIGQGTSAFEPGDTNVEVDLAAGETVICTFTNTAQGGITIEKLTVGDVGSFTFNRDFGASFPIDTTALNPNSASFPTLLPGSYMISEVVPANWTLTDIACSGATNSTITIGGAGGFDPGDVAVTIDLVDGESITCRFTNAADGSITLVKNLPNDNGGDAVPTDFTAFIDGNEVPWGVAQVVKPGNYTASETTLPGYTPSGWFNACAEDGSVVVNPGDDVICEITNDDVAPTLQLTKVVNSSFGGDAQPDDFLPTIDGNVVISGAVNDVDSNIALAINETLLTGYEFVSITGDAKCPAILGGTVTLDEGENVACTITNVDIAPRLTIVKNVISSFGGNALPDDFLLTVGGSAVVSGASNSYTSNSPLAINETVLAGYSFVEINGDDKCPDGLGGTVTLDEGDDITCTISNIDIAPTLTLTKVVNNNYEGTAQPDEFLLTVGGNGVLSGATNDYTSNTPLALNETLLDGYEFVSITGDAKCPAILGGSVTLDEGENVSCTITNNDIAPVAPALPIPVDNKLALLLLTLLLMATGWYMRPAMSRKQ